MLKARNILFCPILCFLAACHHPVDDTGAFVIISECRLPGYSRDVDIQGGYAYIANDQGGLQIVSIADPESTFVVGSYVTQKNFQGVSVRDTFAYIAVAASDGGMMILNVSDRSNPLFAGQDAWFYAYNIAAPEGDTQYAYVAARYWFIVEDVSWPQYPSYVRRFSTPGNVHDLFVIDSIAYLVCEQMGLLVYNLQHPDSTALVSELDTPSNARSLFITGPYAYIADGYDGLVIVDLSDLDSPAIIGSYDTPGYAQGVSVQDSLAFVADGSGGLQIINVGQPAAPVLYGEIKTPYAYKVHTDNGLICLVDRDLGLVIIQEETQP
ncbi:MAG TPA: hypothetical protein VF399_12975 [bacterium]